MPQSDCRLIAYPSSASSSVMFVLMFLLLRPRLDLFTAYCLCNPTKNGWGGFEPPGSTDRYLPNDSPSKNVAFEQALRARASLR